MKQIRIFLLPLDGMLVHHRSLPCNLLGIPNNSPVLICTLGWREALSVRVKCLAQEHNSIPGQGLNPDHALWGQGTNHEAIKCLPHLGGYRKYGTWLLEVVLYEFSQVVYFPVKHLCL